MKFQSIERKSKVSFILHGKCVFFSWNIAQMTFYWIFTSNESAKVHIKKKRHVDKSGSLTFKFTTQVDSWLSTWKILIEKYMKHLLSE